MKQYSLRYLYKHLGKALKDVPFEITDHNKVVAVVVSSTEFEIDNTVGIPEGVHTVIVEKRKK